MKSIYSLFCVVLIGISLTVSGQQEVSLETCYAKAREKFPLTQQLQLIDLTKEFTLDNISKGYLPQISIQAQATYQSEVTTLPIKLPGVTVPALPNDQYKAYVEIQQGITSNYTIAKQKEVFIASSEIEKQKVEVELYKLRERINDLYFGILLINSQLELLDLLEKDITSGITKIKAAIANGIALKSSEDILQAELLGISQRRIELTTKKYGIGMVLELFTGIGFSKTTTYRTPEFKHTPAITKINRPELTLFESQNSLLDAQLKLLNTQQIPKVGIFLQTGVGNPALNMFSATFDNYYLAGLRFSWNISSFYTYSHDKQLIKIQRDMIDVNRNNFYFQIKNTGIIENMEYQKLEGIIETDKQIIALRTNIANNAQVQLENGAISVNDYINYVNARDKASQNLAIHTIQLLQEDYKLSNIIGY